MGDGYIKEDKQKTRHIKKALRLTAGLMPKTSAETIIFVCLLSLVLHIIVLALLKKPELPITALSDQPSVKINIVEKPKQISEIDQKETERPDEADLYGYKDHKAVKQTVISKESQKGTAPNQSSTQKRLEKVIKELEKIAEENNGGEVKSGEEKNKIKVSGTKEENSDKNGYERFLPSTTPSQQTSYIPEQDFSGADFSLGSGIDLNMQAHPLMSYFSKIRQSVELAFFQIPRHQIRDYLEQRGINQISGQSTALVEVRRDGSIASINIVSSNGHQIVDRHWLRVLKDSGPYAPIPSTWKKDILKFTYRMNYAYM